MKTNLTSLYKTNINLETSGIWMAVGPGVEFLVKRFGGSNAMAIQKAMAKYHKPYAKQIATGNLSQDEINKIDAQVLVEACIAGWKGVTDESGSEIPYSFEKAVELMIDLPELVKTLLLNAQNYENYKEDYREEVGNS